MRAAVQAQQTADQAKMGPRDELKMYISSPLEHVENVVSWWGVSPASHRRVLKQVSDKYRPWQAAEPEVALE
jgi:hypothetical protein